MEGERGEVVNSIAFTHSRDVGNATLPGVVLALEGSDRSNGCSDGSGAIFKDTDRGGGGGMGVTAHVAQFLPRDELERVWERIYSE